jgi:hypothetical protein
MFETTNQRKNGRLTNRNAVSTNQKHGEFNLPMVGLPTG